MLYCFWQAFSKLAETVLRREQQLRNERVNSLQRTNGTANETVSLETSEDGRSSECRCFSSWLRSKGLTRTKSQWKRRLGRENIINFFASVVSILIKKLKVSCLVDYRKHKKQYYNNLFGLFQWAISLITF